MVVAYFYGGWEKEIQKMKMQVKCGFVWVWVWKREDDCGVSLLISLCPSAVGIESPLKQALVSLLCVHTPLVKSEAFCHVAVSNNHKMSVLIVQW